MIKITHQGLYFAIDNYKTEFLIAIHGEPPFLKVLHIVYAKNLVEVPFIIENTEIFKKIEGQFPIKLIIIREILL